MKISGLIIASDGEDKKGMIDLLDIPFYGGNKFLMQDKILSQATQLITGEPLISAPIKAMAEANIINDFTIVGKTEQCEELEELATKHSKQKPFKVIPNSGHIGDTVTLGSENILIPGYFFILQPDLPFVTGKAIDEAGIEILSKSSSENSIYFPVISKDYFQENAQGWNRPFFANLKEGNQRDKFKSLDFVIADSSRINPEFIRQFYNIRMIRSLKGKVNALREFSQFVPRVLLQYASHKLSGKQLEELGSEINGSPIKMVKINNSYAHQFMKDIDTQGDHRAYLSAMRTN